MSTSLSDPLGGGAGRPASAAEGPRSNESPLSALVTLQVEAMAAAWRRGERPRAEEFLARHPGLRAEDAVRLVYEEACLRQESGEESVSAEILGRFPQWRSQLALLLDCNRLLRDAPAADYPEAGDDLGDFRLLAEVGRGAHGRTFVASQRSLAHRLMVLKVTPLGQEEHLSLARLQHMSIVPLYFEQAFADRNVRVMVMPYLGGASLARILGELDEVPVAMRTGRHVLEVLDHCAAAFPPEYPASGPFRKYLTRASYVEAVCWIGACLADALRYAHERGLVHLDVKPSNVLIAGDGQPMLLDFHLARGPITPGLPAPDRVGGTPGFLSPEQHDAMEAVRRGGPVPVLVDGRSDIYSLGLLLYETLGGDPGTGRLQSRRPLERCNSRVSPGLSDVVRKCLAQAPTDRYPDAASLSLDLRRHLDDQPLRGVPNRSIVERWRKWRRRHPAALSRGLIRLVAGVLALAVLAVPVVQSRLRGHQIDAALDEGRKHLTEHRYTEARLALRRGLELARDLPVDDPRTRALKASLQRVLSERTAAELHDLVDLLRFRFGVSPPSPDEARSLFRRGLEVWNARDLLTRSGGGPPDRETERQVRTDLLDLATILADLRVHGAAIDQAGEAVRILRDAETRFGPSPALSRDLRNDAKALGWTSVPLIAVPAPRTAWEHYDLGRSYLRSGEPALAEREFRRSIEMRPGEFWPYFSLGVCADRLGRYQDAVASFTICVALAPQAAECYYNRALVYESLGQDDAAVGDYSRALELNPHFADAALNRGILSFRRGGWAEALDDFDRARLAATNPEALGLILYNAALVHIARKDWPAARDCLKQAAEYGNDDARRLYARPGPW